MSLDPGWVDDRVTPNKIIIAKWELPPSGAIRDAIAKEPAHIGWEYLLALIPPTQLVSCSSHHKQELHMVRKTLNVHSLALYRYNRLVCSYPELWWFINWVAFLNYELWKIIFSFLKISSLAVLSILHEIAQCILVQWMWETTSEPKWVNIQQKSHDVNTYHLRMCTAVRGANAVAALVEIGWLLVEEHRGTNMSLFKLS